MKYIYTLILSLVVFAGVASAQETTVGAQFLRSNPEISNPNFKLDNVSDSFGVVASVTSFETKNIGLTGEGSANFNFGDKSSQIYTAMGGVTLKARRDKNAQPFVKGLGGLVVTRADNELANNSKTEGSIGFKVSGGLDYKKWRVFEVGYMQSRFAGDRQDYFVASTGIRF